MRLKVNGKFFLVVVSGIMAVGCGMILFIWFLVSFVSWDWQIPLPIPVFGALLRLLLIAAILAGLVLGRQEK